MTSVHTAESRTTSRDTPDSPLRATAIVVTYNSREHIVNCLESLLDAGLSVRVVDNASADGTASLVATRFPDIPLIVNQVNVGFPVAVNQGFQDVHTDVVVLVNPDTVVPRATARAMVNTLRANPDIGIVGPRLLDAEGRVGFSTGPFETFDVFVARVIANRLPARARAVVRARTRLRQYDVCRSEQTSAVAVERVAGALMAVRAQVFRRAGGLDEGYFLYYEDVELCLSAWRQGARVVYLPSVDATHIGGASSGDPCWTRPHQCRSQLRFVARHWPSWYQAMRLAVLSHAALHVVFGALRRPGRRLDPSTQAWARVVGVAWAAHTVPIARRPCSRPDFVFTRTVGEPDTPTRLC